jgi:hypothetical protein
MSVHESDPMAKQKILEGASFGERIAELEMKELASYFVVTEQWRQLIAGEKDIVYGPKGSGKSALYSLLMQKQEELFDRGILVIAAEKPSGTPAFQDLAKDPPAAEQEFIVVWKLYFLGLVARALQDWGVQTPEARRVYDALQDLGLMGCRTPKALLRMVRKQARRLATAEALEATVLVDPGSGAPMGISGKLTVGDGGTQEVHHVPVDDLLDAADVALAAADLRIWIVIDRLDVAFAEHDDLEHRALRALFKAYLDMQALANTSLKIFLRTDIWRRITKDGFREASHIAKNLTITWERTSLLNLVVRRMLKNKGICGHYGLDASEVYGSVTAQERLVSRLFPDQVDPGKHPSTFDWMLTRTQDSTGQTAPRELIHLLSSLRDSQLRLIEIGHEPPPGEQLFDRAAFKTALKEVSYTRLTQTVYAEYPQLQPFIELLEGGKTQQTISTLRGIWGVDAAEARRIASALVDIGFFEARGTKNSPVYWVPFLYRDALRMVQGEARGFLHYGRQIVTDVAQALTAAIPSWQEAREPTRGSGPGYEESAVAFNDARTGMPLLLWVFAADVGSPVNFPTRPSVVGAGLRQDMNTELDERAFKIRLTGGPFRWHRHLNDNQGYRTIIALPEFSTISIEDTVRGFGERVIAGLRRARMIESTQRRDAHRVFPSS